MKVDITSQTMTEEEIFALMASVNRRRSDGSVSPRHTPEAHIQLVNDFNKLVELGYELLDNNEWQKKEVKKYKVGKKYFSDLDKAINHAEQLIKSKVDYYRFHGFCGLRVLNLSIDGDTAIMRKAILCENDEILWEVVVEIRRVTNVHLPEDLPLVEDALKKGSFVEVLFAKGNYFVNRNYALLDRMNTYSTGERDVETVDHFVLRTLRGYKADGQLIEQ